MKQTTNNKMVTEKIKTSQCSHCGSYYVVPDKVPGDWKKKLFGRPKGNDWFILFMLVMLLVVAYTYNYETATCRETLRNLPVICGQYRNVLSNESSLTQGYPSLTLNITNMQPKTNATTSQIYNETKG